MGLSRILLSAAALSLASPSLAKAPCPPREPGEMYSWQSQEMMPGDKFAWVFLDVGKDGRALNCKIGKTDIHDRDTLFYLCKSYKANWNQVVRDDAGQPIRTTVKRHFLMIGDKHEKANLVARKQFFREHPGERPECYPE